MTEESVITFWIIPIKDWIKDLLNHRNSSSNRLEIYLKDEVYKLDKGIAAEQLMLKLSAYIIPLNDGEYGYPRSFAVLVDCPIDYLRVEQEIKSSGPQSLLDNFFETYYRLPKNQKGIECKKELKLLVLGLPRLIDSIEFQVRVGKLNLSTKFLTQCVKYFTGTSDTIKLINLIHDSFDKIFSQLSHPYIMTHPKQQIRTISYLFKINESISSDQFEIYKSPQMSLNEEVYVTVKVKPDKKGVLKVFTSHVYWVDEKKYILKRGETPSISDSLESFIADPQGVLPEQFVNTLPKFMEEVFLYFKIFDEKLVTVPVNQSVLA